MELALNVFVMGEESNPVQAGSLCYSKGSRTQALENPGRTAIARRGPHRRISSRLGQPQPLHCLVRVGSLADLMIRIRAFQESRALLAAVQLDLFSAIGQGFWPPKGYCVLRLRPASSRTFGVSWILFNK